MNIKFQSENEKAVVDYMNKNCDALYKTLSELVKINTVNERKTGNENAGQEYLERLCLESGFVTDRFASESVAGLSEHRDFLAGRNSDVRENLVATLAGADSTKNIMLASHMDTERIGDESKWTAASPLSGEVKEGKIYGRGTGDDKSGLAVSWFVMKAFCDLGIIPKKNILLASYSDEEGGGGNGALATALKYPCDACINLDSSGLEIEAYGGGCFKLVLKATNNDGTVASVFNEFEGASAVVDELAVLNKREKTTVRLSSVTAGTGGVRESCVNIGIYTDMTREECQRTLDDICKKLKDKFSSLGLTTEGFKPVTRFFIYGETQKDSREVSLLKEIIEEDTGKTCRTDGKCLSDLSLFMAYCSKNSFNYGVPTGSREGGGPHQPNEHVECSELLSHAKRLAIMLLRS